MCGWLTLKPKFKIKIILKIDFFQNFWYNLFVKKVERPVGAWRNADAVDLKFTIRKGVRVQVPPFRPIIPFFYLLVLRWEEKLSIVALMQMPSRGECVSAKSAHPILVRCKTERTLFRILQSRAVRQLVRLIT